MKGYLFFLKFLLNNSFFSPSIPLFRLLLDHVVVLLGLIVLSERMTCNSVNTRVLSRARGPWAAPSRLSTAIFFLASVIKLNRIVSTAVKRIVSSAVANLQSSITLVRVIKVNRIGSNTLVATWRSKYGGISIHIRSLYRLIDRLMLCTTCIL